MPKVARVALFCLLAAGWSLEAQVLPGPHTAPANRESDPSAKKKKGKKRGDNSTKIEPMRASDDTTTPKAPEAAAQGPLPDNIPSGAGATDAGVSHPAATPVEQSISLPGLPVNDPPRIFWYSVLGFCALSTLMLAFAAFKLTRSQAAAPAVLDLLRPQVNAAAQQATTALSRYNDLATRYVDLAKRISNQSAQPPATAQPNYGQPPPQYAMDPAPAAYPAAGVVPAIRSISGQPGSSASNRGSDDIVEAYRQARTSPDPSARDQFESMYPFEQASWINHEEWRFNKSLAPRFQRDPYGWFLVVRRGGDFQALPWFKGDLSRERASFEGVFEYPEGSVAGVLRVARAATLRSQGDDWTQVSPGSFKVDA